MTTPGEIQKLREKEARIKQRIREIQARGKSQERKERTARLIRWGVVVEALLKAGELEVVEWVAACEKHLGERDQKIALSKILSSSADEAHLPVSPSEKQCAPAASESSGN